MISSGNGVSYAMVK